MLNNIRFGPVHINITDAVSRQYDVLELPKVNVIKRILPKDDFPNLPKGHIAIFCGEHKVWSKEETVAVDDFCAAHDAVVLVDHTCKYHGKYRVLYSIIGAQDGYSTSIPDFDLIIHIGEVSGAYDVFGPAKGKSKTCWRVNPDGKFRDFFHKLSYVFQMDEIDFFRHYSSQNAMAQDNLLTICKSEYEKIVASIPEMPFSNLYIGQKLGMRFPDNSILYLGILNTLRTWSFSEINPKVRTYSNVGGFGIDGTLSTAIGSSYANNNRLTFVVLGDLSFFYDMNSIGNHCVSNNLRILLVNNGKGIEFRHLNHQAAFMKEDADEYVAAAGHWGRQSHDLVRHYAQDLGFKYISASNKEEFEGVYGEFLDTEYRDKPILFEVFTTTEDEQNCLMTLRKANQPKLSKSGMKNIVKSVLGDKIVETIKKL